MFRRIFSSRACSFSNFLAFSLASLRLSFSCLLQLNVDNYWRNSLNVHRHLPRLLLQLLCILLAQRICVSQRGVLGICTGRGLDLGQRRFLQRQMRKRRDFKLIQLLKFSGQLNPQRDPPLKMAPFLINIYSNPPHLHHRLTPTPSHSASPKYHSNYCPRNHSETHPRSPPANYHSTSGSPRDWNQRNACPSAVRT